MQMHQLPTERTELAEALLEYMVLVIGPKKVGKTWLVSFIKDVLFISLEPASKARQIYQERPNSWQGIKDIIAALEAPKNAGRFSVVCIDTAAAAYRMCLDAVCKKLNIIHPGLVEDYGMSWGEIRAEYKGTLERIPRTGRGVILLGHSQTTKLKTITGDTYDKIMPLLSGQALAVVKELTDMNFMLDYAKVDGEPQRIILTRGDEHFFAGCGAPAKFPPILPLLHCDDGPEEYNGKWYNSGWELLEDAFHGRVPGILPSRVNPVLDSGAVTDAQLTELAEKEVVGERSVVRTPANVVRGKTKRTPM